MGEVVTSSGRINYGEVDLAPPWDTGLNTPVVFQHGLGLDGSAWQPWLQQFAPTRRVVCIDLRGHGGSKAAWSEDSYGMDRFSDDVIAVLDALSIDACHFIGESFGGTIGLHLAATQSARVRSLVVCSTAFRGDMISNIAHWPELVLSDPRGIEEWSRELSNGRFNPGIPQSLADWVHERQCLVSPSAVAGIVRLLQKSDLTEQLRDLPVPLQIFAAADSPFVGLGIPRALQELVPLSEIVYVRGARHGVILSHAEECARAAAPFVDRVERAANSKPTVQGRV